MKKTIKKREIHLTLQPRDGVHITTSTHPLPLQLNNSNNTHKNQ